MSESKVFCIGLNKTGTSSLEVVLSDLGYRMGDQVAAEGMFDRWVVRDFTQLEAFCETADAFQDMPFSLPFTFVYLDQVFPGSKFILTERDSPDQWYESVVAFSNRLSAINRNDALYREELQYVDRCVFDTPAGDLHNRDDLTDFYLNHNAMVKSYFRYRPKDLLVLNVAAPGSIGTLCAFLGRQAPYDEFPWIRPRLNPPEFEYVQVRSLNSPMPIEDLNKFADDGWRVASVVCTGDSVWVHTLEKDKTA
jgi:hypothetical protein